MADRDVKPANVTEYAWPDGSIRTEAPPAAPPPNPANAPRLVPRDARRRIELEQRLRARRGGRYR